MSIVSSVADIEEYLEYYLIRNGFLDQTDLNSEELEDKIWENTAFRNHKTEIWRKVGGHKKTCFHKIDEMVRGERLEEDQQGTKMMYRRKDTIKKVQFDFGFTFQVNMLEQSRSIAKKTKKPLEQLQFLTTKTICGVLHLT